MLETIQPFCLFPHEGKELILGLPHDRDRAGGKPSPELSQTRMGIHTKTSVTWGRAQSHMDACTHAHMHTWNWCNSSRRKEALLEVGVKGEVSWACHVPVIWPAALWPHLVICVQENMSGSPNVVPLFILPSFVPPSPHEQPPWVLGDGGTSQPPLGCPACAPCGELEDRK